MNRRNLSTTNKIMFLTLSLIPSFGFPSHSLGVHKTLLIQSWNGFFCLYIYIYIYIYISWLTVVQCDPTIPFPIATSPRCREGRYFFPWIAPLILDPCPIILSVKQGGIKYHFLSFWYDLGLNPGLLDHQWTL